MMDYQKFANELMRVRSQLETIDQSKLTKAQLGALNQLRIHLKAAAFAAGKLSKLPH